MPAFEIRPFSIRSGSVADYACLNEFKNIMRLEALPEDPPVSLAEDVERWHSLPDYIQERTWVAWDGASRRITAFGAAEIQLTGDNEHLLYFNIQVLPERRRQGLGRQMLRLIVDHARTHDRRLMITENNGNVPAGAAFLSDMGGRPGVQAHMNQLRLSELDADLLERWLKESSYLSGEFRLGSWDALCPEDRLEQLAELLQVVANDQPRDTLEIEDMNYTPDIVRQFETMMVAGGQQHWVLYVAERDRDRLAGFTEVFWHPDRPAILSQGFTGVLPEYRGKGLGRWLKAEMLGKILREHPEVSVVRTGNANSNAPMLRINVQLGFKPYISWCVWQVETVAAEQYLAGRS